ncbi:MAG TPA: hypothetical protein ENK70_05215, partial [Methylophaga sp.]|nr:hypothetical protein [Methylophaga sp.]
MHSIKWKISVLNTAFIVIILFCSFFVMTTRTIAEESLVIDGNGEAMPMQTLISRSFNIQRPEVKITRVGCIAEQALGRLQGAKCDILIYNKASYNGTVLKLQPYLHRNREPVSGDTEYVKYRIGRFVIQIIVNKNNPVSDLSWEHLRTIFKCREGVNWSDYGGKKADIIICGERYLSKAYEIYRNMIHAGANRSKYKELRNSAAVIKYVADNPNAIGLCLVGSEPLKGVKAVGLTERKGPVYLPTMMNIHTDKYRLKQDIWAYPHKKSGQLAIDYCEFAVGEEVAKLLRTIQFIPEYDRVKCLSQLRLKEFKAGKGEKLYVVGVGGSSASGVGGG